MTPAPADPIDNLLDEVLQRTRRGEIVDVEELCRSHPDVAEELRCLLPALLMLERPLLQAVDRQSLVETASAIPDFQIIREIGRGAMGVVYEARQLSLGRRVALKVLIRNGSSGSTFPKRFQREAEAAAQLHHFNIVPVFEAGTAGEYSYYAMQLIDGVNLQQYLAGMEPGARPDDRQYRSTDQCVETVSAEGSTREPRERAVIRRPGARNGDEPLSPAICATIAVQIAEGLAFAHEHGILHRDIKPSNILLDAGGRAWIADFGLARPDAADDLTASGELVGTLRYMAPERFSARCDQRSDVYSLGLTLFELLEGAPAFRSDNQAQLIEQILNGPTVRLTRSRQSAGQDLERIVSKSVSRTPEDRYQSAAELATDLRLFLEGKPILARRPALHEQFARWVRRRPLVASLSAAILVLLSGGLIIVSVLLMRERAQSRIADENFHAALDAVGTYLSTVSNSPELKVSGTENLRRELLTAAASYYQSFVSRYQDDPTLQSELANAHFQLGKIQQETGDLAEAVREFERARELTARPASDGVTRQNVEDAEFMIRIGSSLAEVNRLQGFSDTAEKELVAARRIARDLANRQPEEVSRVLELADLESQLGLVLSAMDRADDERACFDRAGELVNRLAIIDDTLFPKAIAIHLRVGNVRRRKGDAKAARTHFEKAVELSQSLVRSAPTPPYQSDLAQGFVNLAELELFEGQLTKARSSLTNAISILQPLADRHPLVLSYREGLGASRVNLGKVELTDGQFQTAWDEWQHVLTDYSRLVDDSPGVGEYQFSIAQIRANMGNAAFRLGKIDEAIDQTRRAVQNLTLLVEKYPDHPEYVEVHSGVSGNLTAILINAGQPAEAIERLEETIAVQEKLSEQRGYPPDLRRSIAFAHINASGACKEFRRWSDSRDHLDHAIRILEALLKEHPGAPEYMDGMANARIATGRLHYESGPPEEAEPEFQQALLMNQALVDLQPENIAAVEALAVTHEWIAASLRESGRLADSLPHYDKTIQLLTSASNVKAPEADPPVGNYQLERAKVLCRLGKYPEVIAACRSASAADRNIDQGCTTVVIAHAQAASGAASEAFAAIADFDATRLSDPRDQIELAAVWALLGRAVADGRLQSTESGQSMQLTQEACSQRAIALIDAAVSRGFRNVAVLHSNPSLDDLRERADYQSLLVRTTTDSD